VRHLVCNLVEKITPVKILSYAITRLHRATLGRLVARREVSHLCSKDEGVIQSLGRILDAQLANRWSSEEKDWIERIEALRNKLRASPKEVVMMDYGAGSPDSNLTAGEMHDGRVVLRTVGQICRTASMQPKWTGLLFRLIRQYRPTVCLELGTSLGISAAYQAAALELNDHGRILSLEGSESLASLARGNLDSLGLNRVELVVGRFQDTLEDVLAQNGPIDYVFIDGHHDESATQSYFRQVCPHLTDGAVLVFDDISWSPGMRRAWDTIRTDKCVKLCVDLIDVGVCVFTKSAATEISYHRIPI
jgi:predicted O-methyltransferase YrrM